MNHSSLRSRQFVCVAASAAIAMGCSFLMDDPGIKEASAGGSGQEPMGGTAGKLNSGRGGLGKSETMGGANNVTTGSNGVGDASNGGASSVARTLGLGNAITAETGGAALTSGGVATTGGGAATGGVATTGGGAAATTVLSTNGGAFTSSNASVADPRGGNSNTLAAAGRGGIAATGGAVVTGGAIAKAGASSAKGGGVASGGTSSATGGIATGGVATGGVATGGVATGGVTSWSATASIDVTPPRVVSISPTNGSQGITSNAKIVITFSEPMDTASIANALSVSPLAASQLSQSWSSGHDVLTITPNSGLTYASGTATSTTTARTYTVVVSTAAKDVAGNPINTEFSATFATLRRITTVLVPSLVGTWSTYGQASGVSPTVCASNDRLELGTWQTQYNGGTFYGFIYFDISSIGTPDSGSVIEQSTFRALQTAPTDAFYPGGSVIVERLDYHPLDNEILPSTPTANLGTLCTSNEAQPQLDVTAALLNDFAAGNGKVLYQLAASGSALGEYAWFSCGSFGLRTTYLTP